MSTATAKLTGMGAIVNDRAMHENPSENDQSQPANPRIGFRVWAPHADSVSVIGTFNEFTADKNVLENEGNGFWYGEVDNATVGDEYKYFITNGQQTLERIDPYAREVTNSIGNGIIVNPRFDWGEDDFQINDWNELVIYELHIGTFNRKSDEEVGTFADVQKKLGYFKKLGINAIQIMPSAEFAGDISWGYNPAHIFAVESAYGGPEALKQLVKEAHHHGIAVILDVVYNHFGPSDLDLWQFDGWSENGKGGIYFYNDYRSSTPWGETRPDYGRGEVRQFIYDNAMMWIDEFRMDGLRYDMTLYMRTIDGADDRNIPDGWSLAQWINREIQARYPGKITIAEDLRSNPGVTRPDFVGGANFSTQWDEGFVHPIREVVSLADDEYRCMDKVKAAITNRYNNDSFERVVYSESHDEVANGKSRVPSEIDEQNPESQFARQRSTLAAAIVFTSPGIPMIFQGQEFLSSGWFDDANPIDWDDAFEKDEIVRVYRDLINLRRNRSGVTKGLTGQHVDVRHVNQLAKVISYHRWCDGGPGDDCVVVANFSHQRFDGYQIGLPHEGDWEVRFDSSSGDYGCDSDPGGIARVAANEAPMDDYRFSANVTLAPYSVVILSQDQAT